MNINIFDLLRRRQTKAKDNSRRPEASALAIPEHLIPILRSAAEDELERAGDNGGDWSHEIWTRVLRAARAAEVFDLQTLPPGEVARLADRALGLPFEEPIAAPTNMEDIADFVALFGQCRELIALRDNAKAQAERGSRA